MKLFLHIFGKFKVWGYHRYPRIYSLLHYRRAVVKFIMSGFIATAVDLAVLYACHGLLGINVIVSTTVAYILSFWVSFYLQKFWTFNNQNRQGMYKQVGLYSIIAFINLNLNGYLMHLGVNNFHIYYLFSQVAVSLLIGVESYLIYKFVIFRKKAVEA